VAALESKVFFAYNFCSGGPILIKFVSNPCFQGWGIQICYQNCCQMSPNWSRGCDRWV